MITVLESYHVFEMENTVGVRTTKPVAEFGPSSIPHTGPMIDVSHSLQEPETMTKGYRYIISVTEVLVEWDTSLA